MGLVGVPLTREGDWLIGKEEVRQPRRVSPPAGWTETGWGAGAVVENGPATRS